MRRDAMRAPAFRRRQVPLGLAVTLLALICAPAATAQSFTWLSPTSLESSGATRAIEDVACPSATQCVSVDSGGQQVTYNPQSGAVSQHFAVDLSGVVSSVACPTTGQCTAVDNLGNQVSFDPLSGAILANGVQTVGSSNPLAAVACPTTTQCTAVDDHGQEATFDPTTGASSGDRPVSVNPLTAVSCASDGSACVTVDNHGNAYAVSSPGAPGAVTPAPVDAGHALSGLACMPNLASCTAVDNAGREVTFTPAGSVTSGPTAIDGSIPLTGVACTSDGTRCTAVNSQGKEITFTPASGATTGNSPASVDGINLLDAVSCPTASQCTAVDNVGNEVTFDPSSGTVNAAGVRSISPHMLATIACPTLTQCTALDGAQREVTFDPTTGQVTGQNGHGAGGSSLIDTTGNGLVGLACPSAIQCTAVDRGSFETTFNPQTGRPNAAGNANIENGRSLQAVACSSVHQCTAVDASGDQITFDPGRGAAGLNSVSPNPIDPVSGDKVLVSVQCIGDHECVAMDDAGNEITFDPSAVDAGTPTQVDPDAHPTSLACPTATLCTAVDSSGQAVSFDPTTIASTQTTAAGPGSIDGTTPLTSVACPSAASCVAVDTTGRETTYTPTALASAATERISGASSLQGVSCAAVYACAAVDDEGNAFGGFLPPASTSPPTVSGTAQQGDTLTAGHGSWANLTPTSYALQWESCDDSGCSPIPGATGSTYTLQPSDVGESIRVQEIATNLGGPSAPAQSAPTAAVLPLPPAAQGPPTIGGTVQQGQTLSEQHASWSGSPDGFAIQWLRCDAAGHGCTAIPGANSASYTPSSTDLGHALAVSEAASNSGGSAPAITSAPTGAVAPARAPDILATTYPAGSVTAVTAVLRGVVYTQSAPASWQFQYGPTTALGHATPAVGVAAGNGGEIPVSMTLTGLRPGTVYRVRLVETVAPSTYGSGTQSLGTVVTFTTPLAGRLRLTGSHATVKHHRAPVTLACVGSPVSCTAKLVMTTVVSSRHGSHVRKRTVACGTATVSVRAGRSHRVAIPVSSACTKLLAKGSLRVQVAAISTSGQRNATDTLWLTP